MKRTQVQLDAETYALVRRRAFEGRRSMSAVIRETLASALRPERRIAGTGRLSFVGSGRSSDRPARPVSEAHDAALADAAASTRPRRRR